MKILIDSHVLLWALLEPERLSAKANDLIGDPDNAILVSQASAWELSIKSRRLGLKAVGDFLTLGMRKLGASWLPIEIRHIAMIPDLPPIHGDPFDRLLVAQAMSESLPLISAEDVLSRYSLTVIW